MTKFAWEQLLSTVRRKDIHATKKTKPYGSAGTRTEIERDYDRILFSSPIRRLADKTQVFPLEKNDSVRTRLTHSHEVSNIARSIGTALCYDTDIFDSYTQAKRDVPAILAAVGLAHDIGNPPFGHEGEKFISQWFEKNQEDVFDKKEDEQLKKDYLSFEGNAQALRVLTRLQILNDHFGLNLTCSSLAALMKYPCPSHETDKGIKAKKKFGYFYSETDACKEIWGHTGLEKGKRHPLVYIMEASDDIAYSVMDAEDAIKKCLVSYRDLINYLDANGEKDTFSQAVIEKVKEKFEEYKNNDLSPQELNDISAQMFRVYAIGKLVGETIKTFINNINDIMNGTFNNDLIEASDASLFCQNLKDFSLKHAFKHRTVLEMELKGYKTLHSIMDMLWPAIVKRGDPLIEKKHKGNPFEVYAYGRISESYKRIFEDQNNKLPLSYKRAQLLADMVSGMTDSFAIDFEKELRELSVGLK